MIIQFWLGAILLLIIASAIFVIPFLVTQKTANQSHDDKRNQLNRALYDVRIDELENDDQQGLLKDKDKIIAELQHNLLDDIEDQQKASLHSSSKLLWLPGLALLIVGSMSMYWSVGAYREVDNWQDTLQRYPALQNTLFNDPDARPSEQDLRDIMLGLRTHLAAEPTDAQGWLLYSRLGLVFKDAELALDAVKKAYALNPQSVDIVLVYAQLKMQKGEAYDQQQAELMIKQLLRDNPTEMQAWSMYAFMALEQQDFPSAIQRWEKMLTLVGDNTKQATMLQDSIRYAKKQMQSENTATVTETSSSTSSALQATKRTELVASVDDQGEPIYQVDIEVAEHVSIPQSGFMIVYAQAVSGPKMPIAAVKLELATLPLTIHLSDENAMMQGIKLSDQSEFIIKARLSKSGDVMNKKGDWEGISQVITKGQTLPVAITITEQL